MEEVEHHHHHSVGSKWTINQNTIAFRNWRMFIAANCLYTSLVYPVYSINQFPTIWSLEWFVLIFSELCFFIDIVISFFKQEVDEEGKSKFLSLEKLATKYLNSFQFKMDILAFIPFGLIFSLIDTRLDFFWILKAIRIG